MGMLIFMALSLWVMAYVIYCMVRPNGPTKRGSVTTFKLGKMGTLPVVKVDERKGMILISESVGKHHRFRITDVSHFSWSMNGLRGTTLNVFSGGTIAAAIKCADVSDKRLAALQDLLAALKAGPAPAEPATSTAPNHVDALERLHLLKEKGAITTAEYEAEKLKLLSA